ncbi:hypothetical protein N431DRAFT_464171 [Stipitochalara longipes BDJ]|nr:hypothetical protein N431DRAFT_464171 [Stipitochalara longipes BDJ]
MAQGKAVASSEAVVQELQDAVIAANDGPEKKPSTSTAASPLAHYSKRVLGNSFMGYWGKGIVASAIMLCALMAIILILVLHENRPLPDWPLTITLNSLISIMVVILKGCMLAIVASGLLQTKWLWFEQPHTLSDYVVYDKAAEGPTNAGRLLWLLRGNQIVASLGLIVIVISVAIDPFTQQVIQYYELTAASDVGGNATLPRTGIFLQGGPHIGAGENAPDNGMLGAVQAGFWTPGSDSYSVSASNCLTGNCTFTEPYASVGICTSCSDLSSQVTGFCNGNFYCNYTLAGGTALSVNPTIEGQWMVANNTEGVPFIGPPGYISARQFIWTNERIGIQDCTETLLCANTTCQGTECPASAAECYIYPCIQTYTAEITNGFLTETTVSSIPMPESDTCYTNYRKDCLSSADWAILDKVGVTPTNNTGSDYVLYCDEETWASYLNITPACIYDFELLSLTSMDYLFNDFLFLSGSLTGEAPTEAVGPTDIYFLYNGGAVNFSRINSTFASMEKTMTAYVRVSGLDNYSRPAQGVVFYKQTLIRVQWLWLILPLVLVALTLLFMVLVMVLMNMKGRRPLGDAFSLGLLLKGIGGDVLDQLQGGDDEKEEAGEEAGGEGAGGEEAGRKASNEEQEIVDSDMDKMQVQMVKADEGGWKLAKVLPKG